MHQAWGALLGGDAAQRARIVAWREGLALVGVVLASVLARRWARRVTSAGAGAVAGAGAGWLAARARRALRRGAAPRAARGRSRLPLANPSFRRLLAVFLVNGIASAVPATLVLFFIRDRLQAPAFEPLFLGSYFLRAALSMPLWVRAVARFGLARSWLAGMLLAIAAFAWAARLGAGRRARLHRWCAWPAAWRWAPTWRCPARCWPA